MKVTNEQILKKVIEKVDIEEYNLLLMICGAESLVASLDYYHIIFSHDFARAYFGTQRLNEVVADEAWTFHLREMVLKKDPIKYLEQFLDKDLKKGKK